jgi:NAD(P)-dependent dehydrogenase (short-subunit alcohol dehydrogenase family)
VKWAEGRFCFKQWLEGKVIIVTGSTQGLGEYVVQRVARFGAAGIVVCGQNEASE